MDSLFSLVYDRLSGTFKIVEEGEVRGRDEVLGGGSREFVEALRKNAATCEQCGEPRLGYELATIEPITTCTNCDTRNSEHYLDKLDRGLTIREKGNFGRHD